MLKTMQHEQYNKILPLCFNLKNQFTFSCVQKNEVNFNLENNKHY